MIRLRLSSPIDIVYMGDPELDKIPVDKKAEYESTRNIEDLCLDEHGATPTIFTATALERHYEGLCDVPSTDSFWAIFAHHVIAIKNLEDETGASTNPSSLMVDKEGRRHVDPEARDKFPRDVFTEIAGVIVQRANGRDGEAIPFASMSQGTWRADSIRRQVLLAARAKKSVPMTSTADKTDSPQETHPTPSTASEDSQ